MSDILLGKVTGKQKVKMSYKNFFKDVVTQYDIKIEGWPDHIPFGDFSEVVTNIHHIEVLLQMRSTGKTKFWPLKEGEYNILYMENERMIVDGQKDRFTRWHHANKGKNTPCHSQMMKLVQARGFTPCLPTFVREKTVKDREEIQYRAFSSL